MDDQGMTFYTTSHDMRACKRSITQAELIAHESSLGMTDIRDLPVPNALAEYLRNHRRAETVLDHTVTYRPGWWEHVLREEGLPASPMHAPDIDARGRASLSRRDLFTLAPAPDSDDETVLRFAWHVLAWGTGLSNRNNRRRVHSIATHRETAIPALRAACTVAQLPTNAYKHLLTDKGRSRIPYLAPAFATKIIYFAGHGRRGHESLILDGRVAAALHDRHGWHSLGNGPYWPAHTYQRYTTLTTRWATELTKALGRVVAPDEIEFWLFRQAGAGV